MRQFHSYGPVDSQEHFCIERNGLIEQCKAQLIGKPEKGGHFFTIWAPRQTGKTWLMRQVKQQIETEYKDFFAVHSFSLGRLRGMKKDIPIDQSILPEGLSAILEDELPGKPSIKTWRDFYNLFLKGGLWNKPLILFIDEVDTTPPMLLDMLVNQFRELYLDRSNNSLHGLALIGVRAVLGVESLRGSPFNIQRSLHVPNFTKEEVIDLYQQYQTESGQPVQPEVVQTIYDVTRGQPGLVSWFGELLTEKYNLQKFKAIDMDVWDEVYEAALHVEWNNTILNLVKKVRADYVEHVLALFSMSDILFSLDADWCAYLYLNGVIISETLLDSSGKRKTICRFASSFIQLRLYNALTYDLLPDRLPILAIEPLDRLSDVFDAPVLNLPALLNRYKAYLKRLKAKGLNPWKEQPRRADLHITEAVGHFHLYAWLRDAIEDRCVISPEFPTGNGRVDLHIKCGNKKGIIEVKSFKSQSKMESSRKQAADYAHQLGLDSVTIALFTPVEDEEILNQISGELQIQGVKVMTVAIGWV
ncbi:MAG: AAA-like domain-containing protein [Desulfobacterales bacterium]|nr:AAA-like domain-containing protein [Desulfobacterales bacterium]